MRYKLQKIETKNPDWKIVSGTALDGTVLTEASVNRVNKKGEVFPNFDNLVQGMEIEASPWTSPAGKNYLFPPNIPKEGQTPRGGAYRGSQGIAKAQQAKAEYIEKAQGNKELGIKVASTLRMAVDIVTSLGAYSNMTTEESIKHWRKWLWSEWDKEEKDYPPF